MNAEARNKQPHSHHAHTLHIEVRHSMHIFSSAYLCITYINIEMTLMAIQIYLLCFAIVYGTAHSHKYISIRQIYKMCHVQFDVFQLFNIVLIIIIISFYFPAFINLYDESMRKLYFVLQYALWVRGGGKKREWDNWRVYLCNTRGLYSTIHKWTYHNYQHDFVHYIIYLALYRYPFLLHCTEPDRDDDDNIFVWQKWQAK